MSLNLYALPRSTYAECQGLTPIRDFGPEHRIRLENSSQLLERSVIKIRVQILVQAPATKKMSESTSALRGKEGNWKNGRQGFRAYLENLRTIVCHLPEIYESRCPHLVHLPEKPR